MLPFTPFPIALLRFTMLLIAAGALLIAPALPASASDREPLGYPVTWIEAPTIGLSSEAVVAPMVTFADGRVNWPVPAFKAGHLQYTAGAGDPGNTVLIGHLSSRNVGNVFKDLQWLSVGDDVVIGSDIGSFTYRVVDVLTVPREDISVLGHTPDSTLTLITCAGDWIAEQADFAERLVVRAKLLVDLPE